MNHIATMFTWGNVWGDDLVVAAFGDMWNLAISIVTPIFNKPLDLFHNKKKPDVVIIANGGCWTSENRSSTHFTATSLLDKHVKLPGSERSSTNPNVDTPPKLELTILIDKTKAKQLGIQEYIKEEKSENLADATECDNNAQQDEFPYCRFDNRVGRIH